MATEGTGGSTGSTSSGTMSTNVLATSSTDQLVPQSIVSVKFNGKNYNLWSRSVCIALKTRKRLGYVDGSKPQLANTDPTFEEWDANNTQVLGWLFNSLDDKMVDSVPSTENAHQIWEDLKMRYGQADAVRLVDLQTLIYSCQQGSLSVNEYFTKLKTHWEEYIQYRTVVSVPCSLADCPSTAALKIMRDFLNDDYVMRFIKGLNENYEGVRTNLLMMKPMPSIGAAFSYVLQHERQLDPQGVGPKVADNLALAVDGNRGKDQRRGQVQVQGLFCRYCKKDNHVKEDCWKLKAKNKRLMEGGSGSPFVGSVSIPGNTSGGEQTTSRSQGSQEEETGSSNFRNLKLSNEDYNRIMNILHQSPPASPNSSRPKQLDLHGFSR
ncbi:unnamed protein product [Linum trigynum]|uniref:Retrotransposon Copia-like N-terminal domain-containing protein n=1 Tax=Linum trigynum TaxID=586398 RepID=A0AAV2E8K4_9ROSI